MASTREREHGPRDTVRMQRLEGDVLHQSEQFGAIDVVEIDEHFDACRPRATGVEPPTCIIVMLVRAHDTCAQQRSKRLRYAPRRQLEATTDGQRAKRARSHAKEVNDDFELFERVDDIYKERAHRIELILVRGRHYRLRRR